MKTAIYRTGSMTVGAHTDDTLLHWDEFDDRRPVGHVSREEALYASPDLQGGHHWLDFKANSGNHLAFNEIIVESDNVRVYSVDDYNMVGDHNGWPSGEQIAAIESYWNTSLTLTEWLREVGEDPHGQWEILLPVSEVISSRSLAYEEIRELYIDNEMDDERLSDLEYLSDLLVEEESALTS